MWFAVYIGRRLMGIWTGDSKIHELYTVACGLYACWVVLRTAMILYMWIPQGWRAIFNKIAEWTILVCLAFSLCNGVVWFIIKRTAEQSLHKLLHWFALIASLRQN